VVASRIAWAGRSRLTPSSVNPEIPAPIPSIARPPEISSRVAIATAVSAGWREYGSVTHVPTVMREVCRAAMVSEA
jgi:hypothetical protein